MRDEGSHERNSPRPDRARQGGATWLDVPAGSVKTITPRDGSYSTISATMEIQSAGTTFAFPTPSPRMPTGRSATFQPASNPISASTSPGIGIAIGSPSQAPHWGRSYTVDVLPGRGSSHQNTTGPTGRRVGTDIHTDRELKQKKSSWKSFGDIFRSRGPAQSTKQRPPPSRVPDPEARSVPSEAATRDALIARASRQSQKSGPSPRASNQSKSPSITQRNDRPGESHHAERNKSALHHTDEPRSNAQRQRSSVPATDKALPRIRDSAVIFNTGDHDSTNQLLLDLDIPNGDMERYSVMFGRLLEPRLSLFDRRQSRRLRSGKSQEALALASQPPHPQDNLDTSLCRDTLQRRATSPRERPIRALSINIAKENGVVAQAGDRSTIHRPRPIRRTKTAPPGSVSPTKHDTSRLLTIADIAEASNPYDTSPLTGEDSLPPTPKTTASCTDIGSIHGRDRSLGHIFPILPAMPSRQPPQRPDQNPAKPKNKSKTRTQDALTPQAAPPLKGRELYSRVKSPEDLERQIVQVSVARQVSVSRARRQVEMAVASKQPMRPRVVELSKNRKSTVVLIEGGDD